MKSIFIALLAMSSCTAKAQEPTPSSVTAAPFCESDTLYPTYQCVVRPQFLAAPNSAKTAPNIKLGDTTIMACFDKYTVVMGALWNCVLVYSANTGEIVFLGDGFYTPLDNRTISCSGENFYVWADIYTGTGEILLPESGRHTLSLPTFDGTPSK